MALAGANGAWCSSYCSRGSTTLPFVAMLLWWPICNIFFFIWYGSKTTPMENECFQLQERHDQPSRAVYINCNPWSNRNSSTKKTFAEAHSQSPCKIRITVSLEQQPPLNNKMLSRRAYKPQYLNNKHVYRRQRTKSSRRTHCFPGARWECVT